MKEKAVGHKSVQIKKIAFREELQTKKIVARSITAPINDESKLIKEDKTERLQCENFGEQANDVTLE